MKAQTIQGPVGASPGGWRSLRLLPSDILHVRLPLSELELWVAHSCGVQGCGFSDLRFSLFF